MRPRQTIVLGLLLLLPVLAFLFLYGFGRNHYALPTYLPQRVDFVRTPDGGGQRDTVFHKVRPFSLTTAGRQQVSSATLGQGLYVVHVLTRDPAQVSVGPLLPEADEQAGRAMMRVQEKFRRELRVRLATLVRMASSARKPDEQGQQVLAGLSEEYGTISGKWFVLGAGYPTTDSLARYEFGLLDPNPTRLPFRPATNPGTPPPGRLVLIDRNQHVRGYYDGTDIHEVERLITEINILLYTYDDHR